MKISIEYCAVWHYDPEATSLAAAIKDEFNLDAELIKSDGGRFEVMIDNDLVFSKLEKDRFPSNEEILKEIKKGF